MCSCSFLRTKQSTCKQAGEVYYKMVRKNPQFILSSESDRYIIFWSVGKVKNCWRGWKSSVWDLDKSGNSRICTVFAGEAVRWNVLPRGWGGSEANVPRTSSSAFVLHNYPKSQNYTSIPSCFLHCGGVFCTDIGRSQYIKDSCSLSANLFVSKTILSGKTFYEKD